MAIAPTARIHPTALVSNEADLADGVEVGPFVVIERAVRLGPDCVVRPHAHLCGTLVMGRENTVYSGAVLGDFHGIQDALTAAMHDVLTAGADPAARFAVADAEADRLLAVYNAACSGVDKSAEQCLRVGPWG